MAEPKTKPTTASVTAFISSITDDGRREDCKALVQMMTRATNAKPKMWGSAIIGFGDRDYFGASGKPTRWFETGFSPRKQALSLYLMGPRDQDLLVKLGMAGQSAGCLYIKRLSDVDRSTLQKLITQTVKNLRKDAPRARPARAK